MEILQPRHQFYFSLSCITSPDTTEKSNRKNGLATASGHPMPCTSPSPAPDTEPPATVTACSPARWCGSGLALCRWPSSRRAAHRPRGSLKIWATWPDEQPNQAVWRRTTLYAFTPLRLYAFAALAAERGVFPSSFSICSAHTRPNISSLRSCGLVARVVNTEA